MHTPSFISMGLGEMRRAISIGGFLCKRALVVFWPRENWGERKIRQSCGSCGSPTPPLPVPSSFNPRPNFRATRLCSLLYPMERLLSYAAKQHDTAQHMQSVYYHEQHERLKNRSIFFNLQLSLRRRTGMKWDQFGHILWYICFAHLDNTHTHPLLTSLYRYELQNFAQKSLL